jgi:hypothetical protein
LLLQAPATMPLPADHIDSGADDRPRFLESDAKDDVLTLTLVGSPARGIVVDTVIDEVSRWADTRDPSERLAVVVDLSRAAFDVSADDLRSGAFRFRHSLFAARVAHYVSGDLQFGQGRMFGILCDGSTVEVQPFRSLAGALDWVNAPSG